VIIPTAVRKEIIRRVALAGKSKKLTSMIEEFTSRRIVIIQERINSDVGMNTIFILQYKLRNIPMILKPHA